MILVYPPSSAIAFRLDRAEHDLDGKRWLERRVVSVVPRAAWRSIGFVIWEACILLS
jgi:hypothetical protein